MQLEFFHKRPALAKKSLTWDRMTQDERAATIRAIARLMVKAIRPGTKIGENDE